MTQVHTPAPERPLLIAPAGGDEAELVAALLRGDEAAFLGLVERHQPAMLRVARLYVSSDAAAEEAVQETWIAVLRSLPRFAGRSSLRTWLFRILTRRAQTYGQREPRSVPFAALAPNDGEEPAVDPERFDAEGAWVSAAGSWRALPEEQLLADETRAQIAAAIAALPPAHRAVITLRDVDGWPAEEVCGLLQISQANQRVLLHRARARVRTALAAYLAAA